MKRIFLRIAFVQLFFIFLVISLYSHGSKGDKGLISYCRKVKTLVGGVRQPGFGDGKGTAARFNMPNGIIADHNGAYLYVVDTANQAVRKVHLSTGEVTTLAGKEGSFGSDDGPGANARFLFPGGITIDPDGKNLYVTDSANHTIRKIVISSGMVTTLAGTAGAQGATDGTGPSARFNFPVGITINPSGTTLYVTDKNNHSIRQIVIATGSVTTLAGSGTPGFSDGKWTEARFSYPQGITISAAGGDLYIADTNNQSIRKIIISTKEVTTLAGDVGNFGSMDGQGLHAQFFNPQGIVIDRTGDDLFVTDTGNHTVRKIAISNGYVTTIVGSPLSSMTRDGLCDEALFNSPSGITTEGSSLFLIDYAENVVRQIVR